MLKSRGLFLLIFIFVGFFSLNAENVGFLYSVNNEVDNKSFYVVLEKMPENFATQNFPANLKFQFLDKGEIWNPTTCAGMPTMIDKDNIWTIEFKVIENKKIQKTLIKYVKNENKKYFLDLSKYNVLGDLNFENENLIFKIEEKNKIYEVKVEDGFYKSLKYKLLYNFFGIYILNKKEIEGGKIESIKLKSYELDLSFLDKENVKYYIIGEYTK